MNYLRLFLLFLSIASCAISGNADAKDLTTIESITMRTVRFALRAQLKHIRRRNIVVIRKSGPNYTGRWAGRFVLAAANCNPPITSFLFRHIVTQNGANGAILTSHDGLFIGMSRDRGRRFEGFKAITTSNGTHVGLGVGYKNLSKDGRVSSAAFAVSVGACTFGYGANAIKQ